MSKKKGNPVKGSKIKVQEQLQLMQEEIDDLKNRIHHLEVNARPFKYVPYVSPSPGIQPWAPYVNPNNPPYRVTYSVNSAGLISIVDV